MVCCYSIQPPINFVEWDGLIRLLFNRKNKTCLSSLREKKVLRVLEDNYKTACALAGLTIPEPMPAMHGLVTEALGELGCGEDRPSKMSQDDFIQLLAAFNQRHIHFTN
eukprot:SAG31_NODE_549_length_14219_cov_5.808188_4_plen_109_part_00